MRVWVVIDPKGKLIVRSTSEEKSTAIQWVWDDQWRKTWEQLKKEGYKLKRFELKEVEK